MIFNKNKVQFKQMLLGKVEFESYIDGCTNQNTKIKKKMNKKTFNVHYSFYLSDSIDVEAIDEKDAENKVIEMIENGYIGNLNNMIVGEQKVWIE